MGNSSHSENRSECFYTVDHVFMWQPYGSLNYVVCEIPCFIFYLSPFNENYYTATDKIR